MWILGPKKYQKIARMYDRTGLSTKYTLIKIGFKNARTGTKAKFRPFVDALFSKEMQSVDVLDGVDGVVEVVGVVGVVGEEGLVRLV